MRQLRLSTHEYTFLFCTVRLKNPVEKKKLINTLAKQKPLCVRLETEENEC